MGKNIAKSIEEGERMNECEKREYERLRKLFDGVDEKQLAVLDGAIIETAKLKCKLQHLNDVADKSGMVKVDPDKPTRQKELPVSRILTRVQATYRDYLRMLSSALGKSVPDEGDDEFESEYG